MKKSKSKQTHNKMTILKLFFSVTTLQNKIILGDSAFFNKTISIKGIYNIGKLILSPVRYICRNTVLSKNISYLFLRIKSNKTCILSEASNNSLLQFKFIF